MKGNQFYIYLIAILSMLFWGMSFVWSKIVFNYYQPVTTVFLRLVISTILMFGGIFLFGKWRKIKKEDYRLFLISALFNPFLYFLGESYGLKLSSSTLSAVVIATIPLFSPLAAYYFIHEKLSALNVAGLLLSFAGILTMIFNSDFSLNASPFGILFLLSAVASAIIYSVFLKKLSVKYSALMIIAVQNLIGSFYFMPFFFLFEFKMFMNVVPNFELLSSLIALAVLCSSVAFVFFTKATREIGISRTNVFANLIPVFTGIFSYFILAEQFNLQKITGMMIVIIGLFLTQIKKAPAIIPYG